MSYFDIFMTLGPFYVRVSKFGKLQFYGIYIIGIIYVILRYGPSINYVV